MAVGGEHDGAADFGYGPPQGGHSLPVLFGHGVSHGVGDVEGVGTGGHGGSEGFEHEVPLGARGIFGGEFDAAEALGFGVGHVFGDGGEHLFLTHPEFMLHVQRAGCDEHVNHAVGAFGQGIPHGIDVDLPAAGQAYYAGPLHRGADSGHRIELHG